MALKLRTGGSKSHGIFIIDTLEASSDDEVTIDGPYIDDWGIFKDIGLRSDNKYWQNSELRGYYQKKYIVYLGN